MHAESKAPTARWFLYRGNELLVLDRANQINVPTTAELHSFDLSQLSRHHLEPIAGASVYAAELPADTEPAEGLRFAGLRSLYGHLQSASFRMAGRALQLVEWDRKSRFCGQCGSPMHLKPDERAKECPQCGFLHFPRLDPAIIVVIRRGDQLLLARSPRHPAGRYSTLAGFVEPGESLEEAVHREVMEEVGVTVTNVRYFGSQPWPFPHSLMVGFTADFAGGELRLQEGEIEDAQFFSVDNLPALPSPMSIARHLIDWAVKAHKEG